LNAARSLAFARSLSRMAVGDFSNSRYILNSRVTRPPNLAPVRIPQAGAKFPRPLQMVVIGLSTPAGTGFQPNPAQQSCAQAPRSRP
jgi:hypothetical protein